MTNNKHIKVSEEVVRPLGTVLLLLVLFLGLSQVASAQLAPIPAPRPGQPEANSAQLSLKSQTNVTAVSNVVAQPTVQQRTQLQNEYGAVKDVEKLGRTYSIGYSTGSSGVTAPRITSSSSGGTDFGSMECGGSIASCDSGGSSTSYECPGGTTLYAGQCYPNAYCTTTGSGKGASTSCSVPTAQAPTGPASQNRASSQQASIPPVVTISASPSIVRLGGSSRVTWNGGAADECTVSGPGLSSSAISSSQVVNNIEGQSTYRITCSRGTAVAEDTTRVDIVPLWREL